jgi:hypothetical protein
MLLVPLEELHVNGGFELLDLTAQRRLGHVQSCRRPAEVKFLGNSD